MSACLHSHASHSNAKQSSHLCVVAIFLVITTLVVAPHTALRLQPPQGFLESQVAFGLEGGENCDEQGGTLDEDDR